MAIGYKGYKPAPPEVRKKLHDESFKRHGHRMKSLPRNNLPPAFDCSTAPGMVVLPVNDQGACGDCFMISAFDACSMALAKAGVLPATEAARLSGQWGLDCHGDWGGCNGGDEAQVIDFVKTNGAILTKDYGPYTASAGTCQDVSGKTLYKIQDWGYCTPSQQQGIANTDDMKAAMVQYGPLSVAFDASECNGYTNGTMTGNGTSVDHAVICKGWDDLHDNGDGTMGAFKGKNQWGAWGIDNTGDFWIKYGADSWGTEAIWILGGAVPPPPPPPICPAGQHWDTTLLKCVPNVPPPVCPPGTHLDPVTNTCVPDGPPLGSVVNIPALAITVSGITLPLRTVPTTVPVTPMTQLHGATVIPWALIWMIVQQGISWVCNNVSKLPPTWQPIVTEICGFIPHTKKPCGGC
jgi:hypothetical protein